MGNRYHSVKEWQYGFQSDKDIYVNFTIYLNKTNILLKFCQISIRNWVKPILIVEKNYLITKTTPLQITNDHHFNL